MNKTFLVGADHQLQDLLPWWYENVKKHNPDIHITIADFGLTSSAKEWATKHSNVVLEYEPHPKSAWFYKPHAMLKSPYEYTCWLDIDCEVLQQIDDIFNFPTEEKMALTQDVVRGNPDHDSGVYWWATGVNVVKGKPMILKNWAVLTLKGELRGDQEVLHQMINQSPEYQNMIVKMPLEYQWLRISLMNGHDSPNKKVIHWTGPVGKQHIRENLMQ